MEWLFYIGGTNGQVMPRGAGVLQNAFSSNLDTKSENSSQPLFFKIYLKKKPWPCYEIIEDFILEDIS